MGKSEFTVVHVEKDVKVMIITIALLTQKKVTVAQQAYFHPARVCLLQKERLCPPKARECRKK